MAGVLAYANSFAGVFLFDDNSRILENPHLGSLWPLWDVLSGTTRPLVQLTLALNYAVGKFDVTGYHVVNLLLHLLTGWTLCAWARRTLALPALGAQADSARWVACAVALLWMVHPLHTQAVTYLIQRAETLMALCYLLVLYGLIRGAGSPRPSRWHTVAIVCCALGMASKPVMVTAPIMALVYDRVFLAGSFRRALRERPGLYLGLSATWLVLAAILLSPHESEVAAGLEFTEISAWEYARSQPGVILRYLRVAVWPVGLVFDYEWPVTQTVGAVLWPSLGLVVLLVAVRWLWRRNPALGFFGLWPFLIVLPSSSVIPIRDLAVEHRMYLPLAGLITLGVLAVHRLLIARWPSRPTLRRVLAAGLVTALTALLGAAAFQRNRLYYSAGAFWGDTVAKRPRNTRAHTNLGNALFRDGKLEEAVAHYTEALRLGPVDAIAEGAEYNLGAALSQLGRYDEAIPHFQASLRINPARVDGHNNLGVALSTVGRHEEAVRHLTQALMLRPAYPAAHTNLGNVLLSQDRHEEAITHYVEALRLDPGDAETQNNLGVAYAAIGRTDLAESHYREALRLRPEYAKAHNNLGELYLGQGKLHEAAHHFTEAIRIDPRLTAARDNLELVRRQQQAIQARPDAETTETSP